MLEKFPDLTNAPSSLIFELILNLSEARRLSARRGSVHDRFFPREEGGTCQCSSSLVEVELQKLLAQAQRAVPDALAGRTSGSSGRWIASFTRDGLQPFLQSARTRLSRRDGVCHLWDGLRKRSGNYRLRPLQLVPMSCFGLGWPLRNCLGPMSSNGGSVCSPPFCK